MRVCRWILKSSHYWFHSRLRGYCAANVRDLPPNCPPAVGFYGGQFVCKSLPEILVTCWLCRLAEDSLFYRAGSFKTSTNTRWPRRLTTTVFLGPMVLQSFHGSIHPFWIVGALHDRLSRKILMFGSPVVSEGLEVAERYQFLNRYRFEIEDIPRSPIIDFTGQNPQV